jgi:hypothetical protein
LLVVFSTQASAYLPRHRASAGGLTVAPSVERRGPADETAGEWNAWGERLGDPMQLPASYLREHLSIGYGVTRD